jgi:hypothetical protein
MFFQQRTDVGAGTGAGAGAGAGAGTDGDREGGWGMGVNGSTRHASIGGAIVMQQMMVV